MSEFARHAASLYADDAISYARRGQCGLARHHLNDARESLRADGPAPRVRAHVREAASAVRSCRGRS